MIRVKYFLGGRGQQYSSGWLSHFQTASEKRGSGDFQQIFLGLVKIYCGAASFVLKLSSGVATEVVFLQCDW